MLLLIVIVSVSVMFFFELLSLFRSRKWKPSIVYSILLLLSIAIAVLFETDKKILDPTGPIENLINGIPGLR